MKTKNPIRGLLIYSFHAVSGNWAIALAVCLVLTGILLVTGDYAFFILLGMTAILAPPVLIMMNMSGISKWERFQLAMPVTRSNLVSAQYLEIILSSLIGIPFVVVIAGIAAVLHEGIFYDFTVVDAIIVFSTFWIWPLFTAGLSFPLVCTKIGEKRETAIIILCVIAVSMFNSFMPWAGYRLGLSANITSSLMVVIPVIVFIVSYFITRRLYAIKDF